MIKIENGPCIGGFSNNSWSSPKDPFYVYDDLAVLFNLTNEKVFPAKGQFQRAITCSKDKGICFGDKELEISDPFNDPKIYISRT